MKSKLLQKKEWKEEEEEAKKSKKKKLKFSEMLAFAKKLKWFQWKNLPKINFIQIHHINNMNMSHRTFEKEKNKNKKKKRKKKRSSDDIVIICMFVRHTAKSRKNHVIADAWLLQIILYNYREITPKYFTYVLSPHIFSYYHKYTQTHEPFRLLLLLQLFSRFFSFFLRFIRIFLHSEGFFFIWPCEAILISSLIHSLLH